ncbi:MAG: GTPase Era [Chloroflexi bacterium]|nr:GTPase Era [Chloroflexota bacterium]
MSDDLDSLFTEDWPEDHRSGVITVAGRPNVGKSTLINRILGQKIAIVSPKPQTTRRRQLGILTDAHSQILFVDTPGLHAPQHKLGEYMVQVAEQAFKDTDVILIILDVSKPPETGDQRLAETVERLRGRTPVILALNKVDLLSDEQRDTHIDAHKALIPHEGAHLISAMNGDGVAALLADLRERMPLGPRYYPPEDLTEMNMRFVASEVIREKVMLNTDKEIPYAVAVEIDSFRENEDNVFISATLHVERDSQKGIVIGKGGAMIKKIGTEARRELVEMLETVVHLDLNVKVLKNWRKNERLMQRLGYRQVKEDKR